MPALRLASFVCLLVSAVLLAGAAASAENPPDLAALLEAGREGEALLAAREYSRQHPAEADALLAYGRLEADLGSVDEAVTALESAYFLTREPAVLREKAETLLQAGQQAAAEGLLREYLHQHDADPRGYALLARAMLARKSYAEATAAVGVALGLDPKCAVALLTQSQLRQHDGDLAGARAALEQALQADPACAEAWLRLGELQHAAGDAPNARASWARYVRAAPTATAAWLLREGLYPLAGRPYACTGYYPTFSPDGHWVAMRGRGDANSVYVAPVERPDQVERLCQTAGTVFALDWSPDGRFVLCRHYRQEKVGDKQQYRYALTLVTLPPEPKATLLYEGTYFATAAFSPDGREVWFDSYQPKRGLQAIPVTGGAPRLAVPCLPTETFSTVVRHPDGRRVLVQRYVSDRREYQLVLMDPSARAQDQVLLSSPAQVQNPLVTPDGTHALLFMRRTGTWDLMALALDRLALARPLVRGLRSLMPPALSADGRALLLTHTDPMLKCELVRATP